MFKHYAAPSAALLAVLTATVYADVARAQQTAGASSTPTGLEEVVVTAQRRVESLHDVPIAISSFSGEQLETAGVLRTNDLSRVTPGLQLNTLANNGQAFMRGVGTTNLGGNVEGAVAFYVDDVYFADTAGVLTSLNNIERVEVLKGPQGSLYGRNAVGGLIHVITPDPLADGYVQAQLGYEDYDTVTGAVYATGGLSDRLKGSISASVHDQGEGFGKNLTTQKDVNYLRYQAYRGKLLWDPSAADRVTLTGTYFKDTSDMSGISMVAKNTINSFGVGYAGAPYDARQNVLTDHETVAYDGSLRWEHSFANDITFKSVSAYRNSSFDEFVDGDVGPAPIAQNRLLKDLQSYQQEFLLQGGADRLKWTGGLFYLHSDTDFSPVIAVGAMRQRRPTLLKLDTYAMFGQVDYKLSDRDTLTVGARYTIDKQTMDAKIVALAGLPVPPGTVIGSTQESTDYDEPTWRLALKHDFSEDLMTYGSYSRGYKSGVYNTTPPYNEVDPEYLDAYEVGLKAKSWDGRLQFGVNGFFYDYRDMQLLTIAGTLAYLTNAAKSEMYGMEADAALALPVPVGNLELRANVGAMHSEFKEYQGCKIIVPKYPLPGNTVNNAGDCSGNELPFTPEFTSNLGANYVLPVGKAGGSLGMNVSYYYSAGGYSNADNVIKQDAYDLINAEVSYTFPNDRAAVRLYGRNLTDEHTYIVTSLDASINQTPIAPRVFGVELSYRLD